MQTYDLYLDVKRPTDTAFDEDEVDQLWEVTDNTGRDVAVLGVIESDLPNAVRLSMPIVSNDYGMEPKTWSVTFDSESVAIVNVEIKEVHSNDVDAPYVR